MTATFLLGQVVYMALMGGILSGIIVGLLMISMRVK